MKVGDYVTKPYWSTIGFEIVRMDDFNLWVKHLDGEVRYDIEGNWIIVKEAEVPNVKNAENEPLDEVLDIIEDDQDMNEQLALLLFAQSYNERMELAQMLANVINDLSDEEISPFLIADAISIVVAEILEDE